MKIDINGFSPVLHVEKIEIKKPTWSVRIHESLRAVLTLDSGESEGIFRLKLEPQVSKSGKLYYSNTGFGRQALVKSVCRSLTELVNENFPKQVKEFLSSRNQTREESASVS